MEAVKAVEALYPGLIEGNVADSLRAFDEKATVNSPLGGKELPQEWVSETRAWLGQHDARVESIHTVVADDRVAHELTLYVTIEGQERELPVMLIADVQADRIRDLRIYHSTWPLTGTHQVRGPVMDYTLADRPPEPVGGYHAALAAGDSAAADAQFERGGFVREPAGSRFTHQGPDRTAWYETILSDGPLPLKLGTISDDGVTVVYEYLVDRWGSTSLPRQAGAAAYTRAPSGLLASARIYDDVDPPEALVR